MSDSDIYYYFILVMERESQVFMDFVTILFAFIVAGYFFAHSLNRNLTWLLVGTYTLIQTLIFFNIVGQTLAMSELVVEMKARKMSGSSSFDWLGLLAAPDFAITALHVGTYIVLILSFLGSVWFFFQRHRSAKPSLSDLP